MWGDSGGGRDRGKEGWRETEKERRGEYIDNSLQCLGGSVGQDLTEQHLPKR